MDNRDPRFREDPAVQAIGMAATTGIIATASLLGIRSFTGTGALFGALGEALSDPVRTLGEVIEATRSAWTRGDARTTHVAKAAALSGTGMEYIGQLHSERLRLRTLAQNLIAVRAQTVAVQAAQLASDRVDRLMDTTARIVKDENARKQAADRLAAYHAAGQNYRIEDAVYEFQKPGSYITHVHDKKGNLVPFGGPHQAPFRDPHSYVRPHVVPVGGIAPNQPGQPTGAAVKRVLPGVDPTGMPTAYAHIEQAYGRWRTGRPKDALPEWAALGADAEERAMAVLQRAGHAKDLHRAVSDALAVSTDRGSAARQAVQDRLDRTFKTFPLPQTAGGAKTFATSPFEPFVLSGLDTADWDNVRDTVTARSPYSDRSLGAEIFDQNRIDKAVADYRQVVERVLRPAVEERANAAGRSGMDRVDTRIEHVDAEHRVFIVDVNVDGVITQARTPLPSRYGTYRNDRATSPYTVKSSQTVGGPLGASLRGERARVMTAAERALELQTERILKSKSDVVTGSARQVVNALNHAVEMHLGKRAVSSAMSPADTVAHSLMTSHTAMEVFQRAKSPKEAQRIAEGLDSLSRLSEAVSYGRAIAVIDTEFTSEAVLKDRGLQAMIAEGGKYTYQSGLAVIEDGKLRFTLESLPAMGSGMDIDTLTAPDVTRESLGGSDRLKRDIFKFQTERAGMDPDTAKRLLRRLETGDMTVAIADGGRQKTMRFTPGRGWEIQRGTVFHEAKGAERDLLRSVFGDADLSPEADIEAYYTRLEDSALRARNVAVAVAHNASADTPAFRARRAKYGLGPGVFDEALTADTLRILGLLDPDGGMSKNLEASWHRAWKISHEEAKALTTAIGDHADTTDSAAFVRRVLADAQATLDAAHATRTGGVSSARAVAMGPATSPGFTTNATAFLEHAFEARGMLGLAHRADVDAVMTGHLLVPKLLEAYASTEGQYAVEMARHGLNARWDMTGQILHGDLFATGDVAFGSTDTGFNAAHVPQDDAATYSTSAFSKVLSFAAPGASLRRQRYQDTKARYLPRAERGALGERAPRRHTGAWRPASVVVGGKATTEWIPNTVDYGAQVISRRELALYGGSPDVDTALVDARKFFATMQTTFVPDSSHLAYEGSNKYVVAAAQTLQSVNEGRVVVDLGTEHLPSQAKIKKAAGKHIKEIERQHGKDYFTPEARVRALDVAERAITLHELSQTDLVRSPVAREAMSLAASLGLRAAENNGIGRDVLNTILVKALDGESPTLRPDEVIAYGTTGAVRAPKKDAVVMVGADVVFEANSARLVFEYAEVGGIQKIRGQMGSVKGMANTVTVGQLSPTGALALVGDAALSGKRQERAGFTLGAVSQVVGGANDTLFYVGETNKNLAAAMTAQRTRIESAVWELVERNVEPHEVDRIKKAIGDAVRTSASDQLAFVPDDTLNRLMAEVTTADLMKMQRSAGITLQSAEQRLAMGLEGQFGGRAAQIAEQGSQAVMAAYEQLAGEYDRQAAELSVGGARADDPRMRQLVGAADMLRNKDKRALAALFTAIPVFDVDGSVSFQIVRESSFAHHNVEDETGAMAHKSRSFDLQGNPVLRDRVNIVSSAILEHSLAGYGGVSSDAAAHLAVAAGAAQVDPSRAAEVFGEELSRRGLPPSTDVHWDAQRRAYYVEVGGAKDYFKTAPFNGLIEQVRARTALYSMLLGREVTEEVAGQVVGQTRLVTADRAAELNALMGRDIRAAQADVAAGKTPEAALEKLRTKGYASADDSYFYTPKGPVEGAAKELFQVGRLSEIAEFGSGVDALRVRIGSNPAEVADALRQAGLGEADIRRLTVSTDPAELLARSFKSNDVESVRTAVEVLEGLHGPAGGDIYAHLPSPYQAQAALEGGYAKVNVSHFMSVLENIPRLNELDKINQDIIEAAKKEDYSEVRRLAALPQFQEVAGLQESSLLRSMAHAGAVGTRRGARSGMRFLSREYPRIQSSFDLLPNLERLRAAVEAGDVSSFVAREAEARGATWSPETRASVTRELETYAKGEIAAGRETKHWRGLGVGETFVARSDVENLPHQYRAELTALEVLKTRVAAGEDGAYAPDTPRATAAADLQAKIDALRGEIGVIEDALKGGQSDALLLVSRDPVIFQKGAGYQATRAVVMGRNAGLLLGTDLNVQTLIDQYSMASFQGDVDGDRAFVAVMDSGLFAASTRAEKASSQAAQTLELMRIVGEVDAEAGQAGLFRGITKLGDGRMGIDHQATVDPKLAQSVLQGMGYGGQWNEGFGSATARERAEIRALRLQKTVIGALGASTKVAAFEGLQAQGAFTQIATQIHQDADMRALFTADELALVDRTAQHMQVMDSHRPDLGGGRRAFFNWVSMVGQTAGMEKNKSVVGATERAVDGRRRTRALLGMESREAFEEALEYGLSETTRHDSPLQSLLTYFDGDVEGARAAAEFQYGQGKVIRMAASRTDTATSYNAFAANTKSLGPSEGMARMDPNNPQYSAANTGDLAAVEEALMRKHRALAQAAQAAQTSLEGAVGVGHTPTGALHLNRTKLGRGAVVGGLALAAGMLIAGATIDIDSVADGEYYDTPQRTPLRRGSGQSNVQALRLSRKAALARQQAVEGPPNMGMRLRIPPPPGRSTYA